MPAIVTKVHGSRSVYVRVCPRGPVWRRLIEQLRPRYGVEDDLDPGQASQSMTPLEYLITHTQKCESVKLIICNRDMRKLVPLKTIHFFHV